MKKYRTIILISIIIIVIIACSFYWMVEGGNFYKKHIGLDLPKDSKVLIKYDSHGGPHGDGEYYSEIQLSESGIKKIKNDISKTGKWTLLPIPEELTSLVYSEKNYKEVHKGIPKDIKNGLYFLRDRYAERYNDPINTTIISRKAYNFTIAILDIDTRKLYIYELDT